MTTVPNYATALHAPKCKFPTKQSDFPFRLYNENVKSQRCGD